MQTDSRFYQVDVVSTGTTPNQAWIFQWATNNLSPISGPNGYALIQQWMRNDEASWLPSANGIFTDIQGDYNWGVHVNIDALADYGVGFVVGVHSTTGLGHLVAVDGNSGVGMRCYAYAPTASSSQNMIEFQGRRNPFDNEPTGQFTGDWLEAYDDGTSVFRVNFQGSAFFGGASGTPVLTLGRGVAGVDYDFLKVEGESSDLTMSWLQGDKLLKINATNNLLGLAFGNPSAQLTNVLNALIGTLGANAAGFSSQEDSVFFLEARDYQGVGGAVFAGIQNPGANLANGAFLATFAGAGYCDGNLPTAASMTMIADGAWSNTRAPGKIVLSTQPTNETAAQVTRMTIFNDGKVAIGPGAATSLLDVNGDVEVASTGAFILGDPTASTGAWRIALDGNNPVIQRRVLGDWITKNTINA